MVLSNMISLARRGVIGRRMAKINNFVFIK